MNSLRNKILKKELLNSTPEAILFSVNFVLLFILYRLYNNSLKVDEQFCTWILGIILVTIGIYVVCNLYKSNKRLTNYFVAELLDKELNTNNQIATGWELLKKKSESQFYQMAIKDGLEILNEQKNFRVNYCQSKTKKYWYLLSLFIITMFMGITILLKQPTNQQTDKTSIKMLYKHILSRVESSQSKSLKFTSGKTKISKSKNNQSTASFSAKNSKGKSGIINHQLNITTTVNQQSSASAPEDYSTESKTSPGKKTAKMQSSKLTQKYNTSKSKSSKGTGGKGQQGLDGISEKSLSMPEQGLTGNDMLDQQSKRKHKKKKKKKNNSRGGLRPLSPDKKHAQGVGKEDNPNQEKHASDGRGDGIGQKKTRGTASMMSAIPQPDLVNGALSLGRSISHFKQSIPRSIDDYRSATDFHLRECSENIITREKINPALKQTIKNFLIKIHNENRK